MQHLDKQLLPTKAQESTQNSPNRSELSGPLTVDSKCMSVDSTEVPTVRRTAVSRAVVGVQRRASRVQASGHHGRKEWTRPITRLHPTTPGARQTASVGLLPVY